MALVISRRAKQGVIITVPPSDKETVIYLEPREMTSKSVRLCFTSDKSVSILRDELIQAAKEDD